MATTTQADADLDLEAFTVLDWLGTAWTLGAIAGLFVFPLIAASLSDAYASFGDIPLPVLTRLVLQPWLPPLFAIVSLAVLAHGLRPNVEPGRRRFRVAACLLSSFALAVSVTAGYWPIFEVADSITADHHTELPGDRSTVGVRSCLALPRAAAGRVIKSKHWQHNETVYEIGSSPPAPGDSPSDEAQHPGPTPARGGRA